MTESDLVAALRPVADALDALGVRYYLGGSVASSAHGIARASLDADIVAALEPEHVEPFAVLAKLEWFRVGGETSERQWWDIVGILKVTQDADRE